MSDDIFVYGRDSVAARHHFAGVQGGRCAICKRHLRETLALDHEHSETGLCRGLLCNTCNLGLGFFADDPLRLAAAVEYLAAHERRNAAYTPTVDAEERRVKVEKKPLDGPLLERRDRIIVELIDRGETTKSVADRFYLSISQVNRIYSKGA